MDSVYSSRLAHDTVGSANHVPYVPSRHLSHIFPHFCNIVRYLHRSPNWYQLILFIGLIVFLIVFVFLGKRKVNMILILNRC